MPQTLLPLIPDGATHINDIISVVQDDDPDLAGALYVDGHVRLYHGKMTKLLQDVPRQPTKEELKADPYRVRFTLLFDREGYSPAFFKRMWQTHRIACITYHKHSKEDWREDELIASAQRSGGLSLGKTALN